MLSPYQIAEAIEAETERMEGLVDDLRQAGVDAARTEADFKVAYAQERVKVRSEALRSGSRITADMADDAATVATEDLRYAYLLAENNLSTLREAIRASQAHIDGLRTQAASHRGIAS